MATAENPGRGVMILVFGILGFVCCGLFAPVAWILGRQDLAKIRAGEISPEAEQFTKIGMILGIIGSCLFVLQLLALCVWGLFVVIIGGSATRKTGMLEMFLQPLNSLLC